MRSKAGKYLLAGGITALGVGSYLYYSATSTDNNGEVHQEDEKLNPKPARYNEMSLYDFFRYAYPGMLPEKPSLREIPRVEPNDPDARPTIGPISEDESTEKNLSLQDENKPENPGTPSSPTPGPSSRQD
jgi:hypothetical protein